MKGRAVPKKMFPGLWAMSVKEIPLVHRFVALPFSAKHHEEIHIFSCVCMIVRCSHLTAPQRRPTEALRDLRPEVSPQAPPQPATPLPSTTHYCSGGRMEHCVHL